ncbi:cysteine sulfinic acid decarboxylase-like [Schistocerca piceifrons]|uniref:cysteine sulfinic acid decarboxylase-like n=1 Tax=Schistocerca piceifrons TaxID=274613 RepID=UPI001F5EC6F3|nr:cysteine sulfinic acid decarboxylase-like [Schistocerca piceifrons]
MSEWFRTLPVESIHGPFLLQLVEHLLKEAVFGGTRREEPVVRWRDPQRLRDILHLTPTDKPASHEELLQDVADIVRFSTKTGHPYFINQLYSGLDPYGLAGQWVAASLNASAYTYEVAPVFTLMEMTVLEKMNQLVGFPDGEGVFCPGGSLANGYAINLARYRFSADIKNNGMRNVPQLILFSSEDAHYSVHKMSALLGIGEQNVWLISTDACGRMNVEELEKKIGESISNGYAPFMVIATAGTTVLGAIDPLNSIADLCAKHSLWMHVDAAWGGGILFSRKYCSKLNGINRADSVVWNPHKLLASPQQCSVLLVRHPGLLKSCHAREAAYLFQKDKFYDTSYDIGDKYLQCGRRPDVMHFWLMWKAKGSEGFEQHVDSLMDCSRYLTTKIKAHKAFKLVLEPEYINVCFWYIPKRLQGLDNQNDFHQSLHKVAAKLKELMMKKGSMMINYQPLRNWPNFFRFVVQNSAVTHADIDYFLEELDRLGSSL